MKTVKFIRSIVIDKVTKLSGLEYFEYVRTKGPRLASRVTESDEVLLTEKFERAVVPITQLCMTGAADVYIAYSEEVEKDLGIPIRAIITSARAKEANYGEIATKFNILLDTSRELYRLRWFDRLKFLFGLYKLKNKPPRGVKL